MKNNELEYVPFFNECQFFIIKLFNIYFKTVGLISSINHSTLLTDNMTNKQMTLVSLTSLNLDVFFKFIYDKHDIEELVRALIIKQYNTSNIGIIPSSKIDDCTKEFCNLTIGKFKNFIETVACGHLRINIPINVCSANIDMQTASGFKNKHQHFYWKIMIGKLKFICGMDIYLNDSVDLKLLNKLKLTSQDDGFIEIL
ncbi:MAG: hypothetical protein HQK49_18220 [Oligoflexia bacterium]|nr:hypothetical protein [Oligoflexia bacterium]